LMSISTSPEADAGDAASTGCAPIIKQSCGKALSPPLRPTLPRAPRRPLRLRVAAGTL
jgi:hypothetical protein